jgi:arsenate reductase (glutaredoxin)
MKTIIYHNPRCGKSRSALTILQEKNVEIEIVEYLKNPPTIQKLTEIINQIGIKPFELIRTGEEIYKEKFKGKIFSDKEWIKIMVEHPILIERPIVIKNNKAIVGRPPEKIIEIL